MPPGPDVLVQDAPMTAPPPQAGQKILGVRIRGARTYAVLRLLIRTLSWIYLIVLCLLALIGALTLYGLFLAPPLGVHPRPVQHRSAPRPAPPQGAVAPWHD